MKKFLIALIASAMVLASVSAQEMEEPGIINTLWTGFGCPTGDPDADYHGDFRWAGIIDTVQARVDVGKFTMDGMLSWGTFTNWYWAASGFDDFYILPTGLTQFQFLDENRSREFFYLNFIWHPLENENHSLDLGMGTQLDWYVGPTPSLDGFEWEPLAHVCQGDLREMDDDFGDGRTLAGYMDFANTYAWTALGARYQYKDIFQIGIAIPAPDSLDDFANYDIADDFTLNIGASVTPIDWLTIAAAYTNLLHKGGNFYTGVSISIKEYVVIDAWFGLNGIGYDKDYDDEGNKMWGTGAAVYIKFGKVPLWIRPEAGISDYMYEHYSAGIYTGGRIQWDITEKLHLGGWASFAWGAKDKRWDDFKNGGHIFNARPDFTFDINENHSLSAVFEYERIRYPDDNVTNGFIFGLYWTFNKPFSSK